MKHPRTVSFLASATEIVCALGFEEHLVGRSHECDFPTAVQGLPALSTPRFDVRGGSATIDQRVRDNLREAISIYTVDGEALRRLRPDLIVTQTLCQVCAISLGDVERAVSEWIGGSPRIVSLSPARLADVLEDIIRVAEALGDPERGLRFVERLRDRMRMIEKRVGAAPSHPTIACIEWIDPLLGAGHWMPELVAMAGGSIIIGEAGARAPALTWADLGNRDPDVMLLMPCGFDLERIRAEVSGLEARPEWRALRAVRQGQVFLADGNQFFNRPGPRLVESLEILAEILHPETVRFGHEGSGWQRLQPCK
jgi:iron complex transport system substrate-binding protein